MAEVNSQNPKKAGCDGSPFAAARGIGVIDSRQKESCHFVGKWVQWGTEARLAWHLILGKPVKFYSDRHRAV
jgi:hypothetical protein